MIRYEPFVHSPETAKLKLELFPVVSQDKPGFYKCANEYCEHSPGGLFMSQHLYWGNGGGEGSDGWGYYCRECTMSSFENLNTHVWYYKNHHETRKEVWHEAEQIPKSMRSQRI